MGKKAATPEPTTEEEPAPVEPPTEQLKGEFIFPDGSEYKGEYLKKGEQVTIHGEGRLQTGPEIFEGIFEMGAYREGKFISCNGAVYTGQFRHNLFYGSGEYLWSTAAEARRYKGMWRDGKMHGRGSFSNFSFGVDATFEGFSFEGRFGSGAKEQEEMKKAFLDVYTQEYANSATGALRDIAARMPPAEPPEKGKKKAAEPVEEEVEPPREYFVSGAPTDGGDDSPEMAADRAAVEEYVAGPFPEISVINPATFTAFVASFAEGAEKPGQVCVYEEKSKAEHFDGQRLKREQLEYAGQGVEFFAPEAAPGAISVVVFVSTSPQCDPTNARWKMVYLESVPPAEEEEVAAPPPGKKK